MTSEIQEPIHWLRFIMFYLLNIETQICIKFMLLWLSVFFCKHQIGRKHAFNCEIKSQGIWISRFHDACLDNLFNLRLTECSESFLMIFRTNI